LIASGPLVIGCLLALHCLLAWTPAVLAQATAVSEPPATVTLDEINTVRSAIDSSESLSDEEKSNARQSLDQAALELQAAEAAEAENAQMQKAIDAVEQTRESIRQEIETLKSERPKIDANQPLASLQQAQVAFRTQLTEAEKALADASAESSRRQARLLVIPEERAAANAKLDEIQKKLTLATAEASTTPPAKAIRLRLLASAMAIESTLEKLSTEQAYYVTTNELLPMQRERAEQRVAKHRQQLDAVNVAISNYRRDEISELRRQVEASVGASPLSQETLNLLDEYEKISSRMAIISRQRQDTHRQLEEVQTREKTMIDRVDAVGLTEALALLLQNEKSRLQSIRRQFQPNTQVRSEIRELQILTFKLEDQSNELSNSLANGVARPVPPNQDEVAELVDQRRRVLQKAAPAGSALFQELVALDTAQRQLREAIDRYLTFIEEKLLWTRSAPAITDTDPRDAAKGVAWLLSPKHWASVPGEWIRDFSSVPIRFVVFTLLILALLAGASRWRRAIEDESHIAMKRNCVDLAPTIRATAATLLISAPLPVTLVGLGWIGAGSPASDEFLASLGHGLLVAAGFIAPLSVLRNICRRNGLGEGHFGWPSSICDRVRNASSTAIVGAGPLIFAASTLRNQSNELITNSIGRYCVLAFLLVMAFFLHRLLLPSRFWSSYSGMSKTWYRLRRLIYFLALAIPISLAVLVCSGYSYISHAIAMRLLYTTAILLAVLLVESLALRATMLRRRKLSIAQLQQQREQLSEKPVEGDAALVVGVDPSAEVDLSSVSQQARQLIRLIAMATATVLVWMVWSDLLPALAMLDRITLWTSSDPTNPSHVTMRDMLFAIVIIALTVFAVKNLPAVFELLLLQKLPINPGGRYAISTIFRYILGTVGVLIGMSFLSIPWSQLSWIVAAASVGLGFGLQEILANFVSGIILLLEQPIRVGDVVTVDGTTGVVSKMQIRATTVTNWDRQELVVPNKDLITGKLLNWTLSSVVNRIVIEVGVAYGTDLELAHRVILQTVQAHPDVMDDPPPIVTFEKFGDSSLNFVIRCYLPTLDKRLQTIHDLHTTIAKVLDESGVVIPFPQREVRVTMIPDSAEIDELREEISSRHPPRGGRGKGSV
tara:strand:+ start:288493 stop:291852 length:3360 start_codon:yes stop_codon:yes gene_type:complete